MYVYDILVNRSDNSCMLAMHLLEKGLWTDITVHINAQYSLDDMEVLLNVLWISEGSLMQLHTYMYVNMYYKVFYMYQILFWEMVNYCEIQFSLLLPFKDALKIDFL